MSKEKESEWIVEGLIKKNAINLMNVAHDDWCDLLKDKSKECNCDPDITVSELKKEKIDGKKII